METTVGRPRLSPRRERWTEEAEGQFFSTVPIVEARRANRCKSERSSVLSVLRNVNSTLLMASAWASTKRSSSPTRTIIAFRSSTRSENTNINSAFRAKKKDNCGIRGKSPSFDNRESSSSVIEATNEVECRSSHGMDISSKRSPFATSTSSRDSPLLNKVHFCHASTLNSASLRLGNIVAVDSVSPTVFCISESGDLLKWFDCSDYMREPSDIAIFNNEYFVCDFKVTKKDVLVNSL